MKASRQAMRAQDSPLRGGYLVQNSLWRAWLSANDLALRFARRLGSDTAAPGPPRRVLLAVGGHLGDAVIATKAIVQVARALPQAAIGVLSGSWNRKIFEGHPNIRWFHEVDHWKLNRSAGSLLDGWMRFRRTRRAALREIRELRYDAAIDLYAYYPNSARILADSAIPRRIGFTSGGYGAFYTQALRWEPGWRISDDHKAAIGTFIPGFAWDPEANYALPQPGTDVMERWHQRREALGIGQKAYVVLHPTAGVAHKQWRVERWIEVARDLIEARMTVLLTGAGPDQLAIANVISGAVPGTFNLCGRLDWEELRCAIAEAALVLSVDTVAAHLAAAADTPCIALVTGIDTKGRWLPESITSLTHPVPCSPCFRSRGCDQMSCIRELSADSVIGAAEEKLSLRVS